MQVKFNRLYTNDKTFYADGDDGKVWSFSDSGESWDVRNDAPMPDDARPMDPKAWTAAGLPLDVDSSIIEDDTPSPIGERNPVESAAPAPAAPVEADGGAAFATDDAPAAFATDAEPAAPAAAPRESGYRRVGTTVPFVVMPCSLVVPVIRLRKTNGGPVIRFVREDLSRDEKAMPDVDDKTETTVHKTTRVIEAVEEWRAARSLCVRMRNKILALCADTVIGRLCARNREAELRTVIAEVQKEIREANEGMILHRVTDGVIIASIETDAAVAAATVREALREALDGLREAFNAGDVDTMRSIAAGLKGFDALVSDEAAQKVEEAIAEARRIANTVAREVERKGRALEAVQAELSLDAIDAARFMLISREGEGKTRSESDEPPLPETDARLIEIPQDADDTPGADGAEIEAVAAQGNEDDEGVL